jgi:hypothetical protein
VRTVIEDWKQSGESCIARNLGLSGAFSIRDL